MSKVTRLLNDVNGVLDTFSRDSIKAAIGDSTANNRTVTVKQLIRFLNTRRKSGLRKLANNLSVVYSSVRGDIFLNRSSYRTDAVDVYEFIDFLESNTLSRSVTQQLAA